MIDLLSLVIALSVGATLGWWLFRPWIRTLWTLIKLGLLAGFAVLCVVAIAGLLGG